MKLISVLIILNCVLCSMAGCGENHPVFKKASEIKGVDETNLLRSKIGLRLIQPDWVLCSTEFNEDSWQTNVPKRENVKKVCKDKSGRLLWEEDYYYSGASWTSSEGTDLEFIIVNYSYDSEQIYVRYSGDNPEIATLVLPFESYSEKVNQALTIADSIVKNWSVGK